MKFDLLEWRKLKKNGELIIEHYGEITPDVITNSLFDVERYFLHSKENSSIKKKAYNVFVECIQNLFHHVEKIPEQLGIGFTGNFGVIMLVKEKGFYRVSTGNFIKRDRFAFLKDRIDQINSLTDLEVKMLYRDILGNEEISKKGGGGLGMIDIVRKTGNKLEYYFYNYNENYLFFSLDVFIS